VTNFSPAIHGETVMDNNKDEYTNKYPKIELNKIELVWNDLQEEVEED